MKKTIKHLIDGAETLSKIIEQKFYVIESCRKSNHLQGNYISFDVDGGEIHAVVEYDNDISTYVQYHHIPIEYLEMTDDELIKYLKELNETE